MSWILRRFFLYQSHGAIFGGGGLPDGTRITTGNDARITTAGDYRIRVT